MGGFVTLKENLVLKFEAGDEALILVYSCNVLLSLFHSPYPI